MNAFSSLLRNVVFLLLALAGIAMAFVFMLSTAIALGVLYIVARLRGKPFAPAAFWQARRSNVQWHFVRGAPGAAGNPGTTTHTDTQYSKQPPKRMSRNDNVIDVEARDIP